MDKRIYLCNPHLNIQMRSLRKDYKLDNTNPIFADSYYSGFKGGELAVHFKTGGGKQIMLVSLFLYNN